MTPRERVLGVLHGRPVDRFPVQLDFTPAAAAMVRGWLGGRDPWSLDQHVLTVGLNDGRVRMDGTVAYDRWGVGWDMTSADGVRIARNPLADLADLKSYRFPDPDDSGWTEGLAERISRNGGKLAVVGSLGFCLWERYWVLRGFERAMEDLLEEPALVEDVLDRIVAVNTVLLKRLAALGVDWLHTGDDFGAQRGLQYSTETWRRFFKPRYARLWAVAREAGLPQSHHSCGDVRSILDDLAEIGLNMLNPVQTRAMPPEELSDRWGDRLAFWGGVCTQHVLPFESPAGIRAYLDRCRATLGRRDRWLIAPSHTITSEVPRASFFALLEALRIEPVSAGT